MFNGVPSRRERRSLAKKLGLVKKKETFRETVERFARAQEMGKMLHLQHLQNIENQKKSDEVRIEEIQASLTPSSWDSEELKKIISEQGNEE